MAPPGAHTIVELLVVIAIILVVISLILVATRTLRQVGDCVNSLAALRQLATAHAAYAADHRQTLLPGHLNPALQNELGIGVVGPNGSAVPAAAAAPWTWRLMPYVGNEWAVLLADSREASTRATSVAQVEANELGTLALHPSFGMNTIVVGGDSDAGGPAGLAVDMRRWSPFATRPDWRVGDD